MTTPDHPSLPFRYPTFSNPPFWDKIPTQLESGRIDPVGSRRHGFRRVQDSPCNDATANIAPF